VAASAVEPLRSATYEDVLIVALCIELDAAAGQTARRQQATSQLRQQ
jgi:hypothetical protein